MRSYILFIILLFLANNQDSQKTSYANLYSCGADNFPSILVKSFLYGDIGKCNELFLQFNDSLKTRDFPIVFRQLSCINESEQKVGISFFETKPNYVDVDYLNLWILVNYEDANEDFGIHIDTTTLVDSIKKILVIHDKRNTELYDKIKKNPVADSLARPEILIDLNVKVDNNKQLSREDYNKLVRYVDAILNLSITRADELSMNLWGKSYNNLELRQKLAISRLLGYLLFINIK